MLGSAIFLHGLLLVCLASSSTSVLEPLPNAQHIFNAIHSSMRQWGSSLNHNGMSFFLASVPKGVHLHHGRPHNASVKGMEWLAFEPEHALRFAWRIFECEKPEQTLDDQKSLKWSIPKHLAKLPPSVGFHSRSQRVLKGPPPKERPRFCLEPGYLHTYATSRDLNLLYVDGEAAAKSSNGTLDSQDYILLHGAPEREIFDDWSRANDLCQLASITWEGRIDGFIRMEHGFEMILCDFDNLDVVSILSADQSDDFRTPQVEWQAGAENFKFFSSITSRYNDIGGDRVEVYYENFVTAYNHPEVNLFPNDSDFPRLESISNRSAQKMFSDVSLLIDSLLPRLPGVNWQAITTLLTTRYSRHLQLFTTLGAYSNSTTFTYALELLYSPYISNNDRNGTLEIHRCTTAFLPYHLSSVPPSLQPLAQRAFLSVAERVCSTLHSVLTTKNLTLSEQQASLTELMDWLQWTDFKHCRPSCRLDEVCFTAIWPWGNGDDIARPSCKNGSAIAETIGGWDMGRN